MPQVKPIPLGEVRGLLTVLSHEPSDERGHAYVRVRCDCGTAKSVRASDWRLNKQLSCGSDACRITPDEAEQFCILIRDEISARAVLQREQAEGKGFTARNSAHATLEKKGPKRRAALLKKIEERRAADRDQDRRSKDETELAQLKVDFPEDVVVADENRAETVAALRAMREKTDESLTQCHAYLHARAQEIEDALESEQEAAEQAAKQEQTRLALIELEQQKKDDAAFEKLEQTILASVRPILLTPHLPMSKRLEWAGKWQQKATEARESAKRVSDEIHADTGARKRSICQRIANVYDSLAEGMKELHRTRHINPEKMDESFWLERAIAPENFVFRTREEQAWLCWATKMFCAYYSYDATHVPQMPNPTFEPEPPHAPIAYGQGLSDGRYRVLVFRQEQSEAQKVELEKLRAEDPARYEELTGKKSGELFEDADQGLKQLPLAEQLNAATSPNRKVREWAEIVRILQPIDDQIKAEIYVVERATLDQPHLKAEWFWPWGAIVNRGRDVVYDFRLKRWFLTPEPATPGFGKAKGALVWRQNPATGLDEYVSRDQEENERWIQDARGEWVLENDGKRLFDDGIPVVFLHGERPASPDHRNFRYGLWYTDAQVAQHDARAANEPAPSFLPPLRPKVADCVAVAPDRSFYGSTPREHQHVWMKHTSQILAQMPNETD